MRKGSILAFALVAAALSQTAGAITATKEYVDRQDAAITNAVHELQTNYAQHVSNTYTRAETDARIAELAPRTSLEPATNYTDEVAAYKRGVKDLAVYGGYAPWNVPDFQEPAQWKPEIGFWEAADYEFGDFWYFRWKSGVWEFYNAIYPYEDNPGEQPEDVSTNGEYALSVHFPNSNITITRTSIYVTNGAHIVTSDEIAPSVSNTVTKAYVESLGIESGISASTATNIASIVSSDATNTLAKSFAPTISNTVTKAYVESLGIEAGISAETATNIAEAVGANLPYLSTETGGFVKGNTAFDGFVTFSNKVDVIDELNIVLGEYGIYIGDKNIGSFATGKAEEVVSSADTSYRRFVSLTNINQSVQYVNITDETPSTLAIQLPTDGATKDWMVYVVSVTNVTLSLPAETWWMADIAYTNDVPPATPTALWFSQVADGIFILGRQELTEVTAP